MEASARCLLQSGLSNTALTPTTSGLWTRLVALEELGIGIGSQVGTCMGPAAGLYRDRFGRCSILSCYHITGLHFDVESYVYLPFLEETSYMPKKKKNSPGDEVLEHSERIAKRWNLADKGLFRTQVSDLQWNEGSKTWKVSLAENGEPRARPVSPGPESGSAVLDCRIRRAVAATGPQGPRARVLCRRHVPHVPLGLEGHRGHTH